MIRLFILLVCTVFVAVAPCQSLVAQVAFRTVEASAHGTTLEQAINRALIEAITQVNGATLASRARSSLAAKTNSVDGLRSSTINKNFQETIQKKTNGIVKNFEILSQGTSPNSRLISVTLSVTVASYQQSAQLNRLRLAVVPFRFAQKAGNPATSMEFEEYFRRGLENYITQTRRFAVIDRSFVEEQNNELNFLMGIEGSGNVQGGSPIEELAKVGNRVGTDYLITGIVEKAKSTIRTYKMRSTGQAIKTLENEAIITYRIIDVASSQIKFAGTDKIKRENSSLEILADILSKKIGQKILNAIFPIYVLSIDGSNVTLGQGGETIRNEEIYSLIRLGEEIFDPYTGESLGQQETIVGAVKVTETQAKLSTARIIDLRLEREELFQGDFIVRPVIPASVNTHSKKMKILKDTDEEFEREFDKEFNKEFEQNK